MTARTGRIIPGMGMNEIGIAAAVTVLTLFQSVYYVGAPPLPWLNWRKVRHLPDRRPRDRHPPC